MIEMDNLPMGYGDHTGYAELIPTTEAADVVSSVDANQCFICSFQDLSLAITSIRKERK